MISVPKARWCLSFCVPALAVAALLRAAPGRPIRDTDPGPGMHVVEFELEGRVTAITPGAGSDPSVLTVMGVDVVVPPTAEIHTPVSTLSFEDLLGAPFPGRTEPGFLGGTGIAVGLTVDGVTIASLVEIEPNENVLIGEVTGNTLGVLEILGIEVYLIEDWRLWGTAWTENGFLVDLQTVQPGTFAVAEGYLGDDGHFHAFRIEASGAILGPPDQTSVTRAICVTAGGNIDIRGASTSAIGVVEIYDDESNVLIGAAAVEPDEDNPPFGTYRYDETIVGDCPVRIRVENTNGSSAVADVQIID